MLPALRGHDVDEDRPVHPLYWEHVGNAAVRDGNWKLVRVADAPWELYDAVADRSELNDVAADHPDVVRRLSDGWAEWAESVGVLPWEQMREIVRTYGG